MLQIYYTKTHLVGSTQTRAKLEVSVVKMKDLLTYGKLN